MLISRERSIGKRFTPRYVLTNWLAQASARAIPAPLIDAVRNSGD
jgi:hypothetical protein